MLTLKMLFENGGISTINYISASTYHRLLNLVPDLSLYIGLYSIVNKQIILFA